MTTAYEIVPEDNGTAIVPVASHPELVLVEPPVDPAAITGARLELMPDPRSSDESKPGKKPQIGTAAAKYLMERGTIVARIEAAKKILQSVTELMFLDQGVAISPSPVVLSQGIKELERQLSEFDAEHVTEQKAIEATSLSYSDPEKTESKSRTFLSDEERPDLLNRDEVEKRVHQHKALVYGVYKKSGLAFDNFDDLIQAGMIGLWDASKRYEPSLGSFQTFAYPRIHGAMLDWMRGEMPGRIPRTLNRLAVLDNQGLTDEEICTKLKISPATLQAKRAHLGMFRAIRLDDEDVHIEIPTEESGYSRINEDTEKKQEQIRDVIREAREIMLTDIGLSERDADLFLRYHSDEGTLAQLAGEYGITESRVCQIIKKVEAKIAPYFRPRKSQRILDLLSA